MPELDEMRYAAYPSHSGFLSDCLRDGFPLVLRCDSTRDRKSRANSVNALKRAIEQHYGVKLEKLTVSYSETHGFLARTEVRYKVSGKVRNDVRG